MIYKLLWRHNQYITRQQSPTRGQKGWPYVGITHFDHDPNVPFASMHNDQYPFETILSTVRATNRQMYQETLEFIKYPRLRVGVDVDPDLKSIRSARVIKMLSDDFVRENTIEVWFRFKWETLLRWFLDPIKDNVGLRCASVVPDAWRRALSSAIFWNSGDESPFKRMIALLETYSRLHTAYVKTDHGDLLELWKDPVRDLAAFEPLLKRGVRVDVLIAEPKVKQGLVYEARKKTMGHLTGGAGAGAVVLKQRDLSHWTYGSYDTGLFSATLKDAS